MNEKNKNTAKQRDWWSKSDIIAKVLGVILVPIVLFLIGEQLEIERQRSLEEHRRLEEIRQENERLARISTQLTSTNRLERLFALRLLQEYLGAGNFKEEFAYKWQDFVYTLQDMVYQDDIKIAKEAYSLLVSQGVPMDENIADEREYFELLKPIIVNFFRSKRAFLEWDSCQETEIIRKANQFNKDLLSREKEKLAKMGLAKDADKLIQHYVEWLKEYDRIKREDGNLCRPIYVGPKGFPFPGASEKALLKKYKELHAKFNAQESIN